MAVVAMCTGLLISEVLALRWESLNFEAGTMLVERAVVNGRIGPTKTEASKDDVPLDGELAEIAMAEHPEEDLWLALPFSVDRRVLSRRDDSKAPPQTCGRADLHQGPSVLSQRYLAKQSEMI
jgi:integrase